MNYKVATIVGTYNAMRFFPDCPQSIKELNTNNGQIQSAVFIIDSNSQDGTTDYLKNKYPEFRIIENDENLGYAKGNNIGIELALQESFDYMFIVTHDVKLEKDCLLELLKTANKGDRIGLVQPRILLWNDPEKINSIGNENHFLGYGFTGGYKKLNKDYLDLKEKEITSVSGAVFLLKSSVIKDIGKLSDEFFMYSEDMDLSWRVKLRGYKLFLSPQAVAYHFYEFSRVMDKIYYLDRNRIILILRNYKIPTLLLILPALIVMEAGEFVFALMSGWWKEKIKSRLYFFNPKNLTRIFKERKRIQKNRLVSDRQILKDFRGDISFEEIDSVLLKYIANPIFKFYFFIIKHVVFW